MTGSLKIHYESVGDGILAPVGDVEATVQQVQVGIHREESHDRARFDDAREGHSQKSSLPCRLL